MLTVNSIYMSADPDAVFRTASDVLNWPKILPHYRWVRRLGSTQGEMNIEMSAWRSFIPVKWRSAMTVDAKSGGIFFQHIGGLTRGMEVVWSVKPDGAGTRVVIIHDLSNLRIPVVRSLPGRLITGHIFVEHIADRTLKAMKQWMEQQEEQL
jgi:ribosome-associated toxin RatA of RatAB toxin-antitoxin module